MAENNYSPGVDEENHSPGAAQESTETVDDFMRAAAHAFDTDPSWREELTAATNVSKGEAEKIEGAPKPGEWNLSSLWGGVKNYAKRVAENRPKNPVEALKWTGKQYWDVTKGIRRAGVSVVGQGARATTEVGMNIAKYGSQGLAEMGVIDEETHLQHLKNYEALTSKQGYEADPIIKSMRAAHGWIGETETGAGSVVEGIAQAAGGAAASYLLLRGAGAPAMMGKGAVTKSLYGAAGSITVGAVAEATFFDPFDARLSDLLMKGPPVLRNRVFEYLQSDPNDTAAQGRLKNFLEGGPVLGLPLEFMGVLKGIRASRLAKAGHADLAAKEAAEAGDMIARAAEEKAKDPLKVAKTEDGKFTLELQEGPTSPWEGPPANDIVPGNPAGSDLGVPAPEVRPDVSNLRTDELPDGVQPKMALDVDGSAPAPRADAESPEVRAATEEIGVPAPKNEVAESGEVRAPKNEAAHTASDPKNEVVPEQLQFPIFETEEQAQRVARSMNDSIKEELRPAGLSSVMDEDSVKGWAAAWKHLNDGGDERTAKEILQAFNFNPKWTGQPDEVMNTIKALHEASATAAGMVKNARGQPLTFEDMLGSAKEFLPNLKEAEILDWMRSRWENAQNAWRDLTSMRLLTWAQADKAKLWASRFEADPNDVIAHGELVRALDTLAYMHTYTSGSASGHARATASMGISMGDASAAAMDEWIAKQADEVIEAGGGVHAADELIVLSHGPGDIPAEVAQSSSAPEWLKTYSKAAEAAEKAKGPVVEGPQKPPKGPAKEKTPRNRLAWDELEKEHKAAQKEAEKRAKKLEKAAKEPNEGTFSDPWVQAQYDRWKREAENPGLEGNPKLGAEPEVDPLKKVHGPKPPPRFGPARAKSWAEHEAGLARAEAEAERQAAVAAKAAQKAHAKANKQYAKMGPRLEGPEVAPKPPEARTAEGPFHPDSVMEKGKNTWPDIDQKVAKQTADKGIPADHVTDAALGKESVKPPTVEGPNHPMSLAEKRHQRKQELKAKLDEARAAKKAEREAAQKQKRIDSQVAKQQAKLDPRVEGPARPPRDADGITVEGPAHVDSEAINGKGANFRLNDTPYQSVRGMSRDELLGMSRMVFASSDETPGAVLNLLRGPKLHQARLVKDLALKRKWYQYVGLWRITSMLSAGTTHTVSAVSNAVTALVDPTLRILKGMQMGGQLGKELRQSGTDILMSVLFRDYAESFKLAAMSFKMGDSVIDARRAMKENYQSGLGHWDHNSWLDNLLGISARFLMTQEEFFKAKNYIAHVRAEILRKGRADGLTDAQLAERLAEDMKWAFDPDLGAVNPQALQYARVQTFSNDLAIPDGKGKTWGESIYNLAQEHESFKWLVPFIRQPTNAFRYAYRQAPLISRFNREVQLALSKGGPEAAMAKAHMDMGLAMFSFTAMGIATGNITGRAPTDPKLAAQWRENNQEYSMRVPGTNKWISYRRGDPFTMMIGLMADAKLIMAEMSHMHEGEKIDVQQYGAAVFSSLVSNLSSKVYMQGMVETMNGFMDGNPKSVEKTLGTLAGTLVPNALKVTNPDSTIYEAKTILDHAFSRVPGYNTGREALGLKPLAPRRNALGQVAMGRIDTFQRPWNPYPVHTAKWSILDEMNTLGKALPFPSRTAVDDILDLTDAEAFDDGPEGQAPYDRMMELLDSGELGKTATGELEKLVETSDYQQATPPVRWQLASRTLQGLHASAFKRVMQEYPSLRTAHQQAAEAKRAHAYHGDTGVDGVVEKYEAMFGKSFIKRGALRLPPVQSQAVRPE